MKLRLVSQTAGVRRLVMAYFERVRDVISGPFSPEIMKQRTAAGWQLVSIEWRRELPDQESPREGVFGDEIPYGLRISEDCTRLEVNPRENQTLILMMELLGQDFSYSSIVSDLNEKGFRMRNGGPWNRVAVFNLMPRLIEVVPKKRTESTKDERAALTYLSIVSRTFEASSRKAGDVVLSA
jgi:hypothetical protein